MDFLSAADCQLKVQERFRDKLRPLLELGKVYRFELSGSAKLIGTASGGELMLNIPLSEVKFSSLSERRSLVQNKTLRGIERMIHMAIYHTDPTDEELSDIHEGLLESFAPLVANRLSGKLIPKRSSDMDKKEFSAFIDHALAYLASQDIQESVYAAIGKDIKTLFAEWYEWRYSNGEDVIQDSVPRTWPKYKMRYPYCELCFIGPLPNDPLERMHIVSVGDEKQCENEPWNWIHSHSSHHQGLMHQHGWAAFLEQFPHIRNKVIAAYKLAGKEFTW